MKNEKYKTLIGFIVEDEIIPVKSRLETNEASEVIEVVTPDNKNFNIKVKAESLIELVEMGYLETDDGIEEVIPEPAMFKFGEIVKAINKDGEEREGIICSMNYCRDRGSWIYKLYEELNIDCNEYYSTNAEPSKNEFEESSIEFIQEAVLKINFKSNLIDERKLELVIKRI